MSKASSSTKKNQVNDPKQHRLDDIISKARDYIQNVVSENIQKKSKGKAKPPSLKKRGNFLEEEIEETEILKQEQVKQFFRSHLTVQPSSLQGKLKDFQLDGLNWLIGLYQMKINGILADEMGLGKTIQTIALIAYFSEFLSINGPFLVICPKSTIPNWMREFKKWLPKLRTEMLPGTKEERELVCETIIKYRKYDVLITSYEGAKLSFHRLYRIKWEYLVIDEGHKLKNEESLISLVARGMNSERRLLLTGTPLQNNMHELWSLLNFLMPDIFDDSTTFEEIFYSKENQDETEEEIEKKNKELVIKIHSLIRPFILRRLKTEVDFEIPPKKEVYIYTGLSEIQQKMYIDMIKFRAVSLENGAKTQYMNIVMQLIKICNHPYLFENIEPESEPLYGEHLIKVSGKMMLLDKFLTKLKSEDHKVLIFSQLTSMLDIIEDYCIYKSFDFCRIDGSTSLEDREKQMLEFQDPKSSKFIFLLSTRAGGLGINLTAADTVIIYDSDWNPQQDLQAMDRAHRIGQKKQVNVYRFITKGTLEERINERQIIKLKFDSLIIQQGRANAFKNFSKSEIKDMLDFGVSEIFNCQTGTYTDEDIDSILKRGEAKMEENKKVLDEYFSKHQNLLDLNGYSSINTSIFDNIKYNREKDEKLIQSLKKQKVKEVLQPRRKDEKEKIKPKKTLEYFLEDNDLKIRIIKEFPLFRFYDNRERLLELGIKKEAYMKFNFEQDENENIIQLTPEEKKEFEFLKSTGFENWTKREFMKFCSGFNSGTFTDFSNYEMMASYIETKTAKEIEEYSKKFWEMNDQIPEGKRVKKSLEQSLKKIEYETKAKILIKDMIEIPDFLDTPFNLFIKENIVNNLWTKQIDKFLILIVHECGYGNLDEIKLKISKHPILKHNHFIRSRNIDEIKKRIEKIVNALLKKQTKNEKAIINAPELKIKEVIRDKSGKKVNDKKEHGSDEKEPTQKRQQTLEELQNKLKNNSSSKKRKTSNNMGKSAEKETKKLNK